MYLSIKTVFGLGLIIWWIMSNRVNFAVLNDYSLALRRKRDLYNSDNNTKYAELYERYADSLDEMANRLKTNDWKGGVDFHQQYQDLLSLSDRSMIERLLFHRSNDIYNAVMRVAGAVERVRNGKPAKRLFGLIV